MTVFVAIHICLATATLIFYVQPDNSTNVSCPSQPCATLGQYLLDNNGTLPVVSNVEYHFLPGEHQVPSDVVLQYLTNVTIAGATSNRPMLVSYSYQSKYLLIITHSHKVKLINLVIKQCKASSNGSYLFLGSSTSSKVENVVFSECGFQTSNLFGKSTIKMFILTCINHYMFLLYICMELFYYMTTNFGKIHILTTQWK